MIFFYQTGIFLFNILISTASLFNAKAGFRKKGLKNIFAKLKIDIKNGERRIWIHCASLGEFEQGRPLIEKIKKEYPFYKIVLTFFSPSGYEIRKNYKNADYIYYLPNDTKKNAERFINQIKPEKVIFVKYEFWHWYLKTLKNKNIPVYLISGIFREDQFFFKKRITFFRKILMNFEHFFVQNKKSLELLNGINLHNVTIAGDTRFDRVLEIFNQKKNINLVSKFKNNNKIFIAGSTWAADEELILNYINTKNSDIKFIIAPHEIRKSNITRILKNCNKKIVKLSVATKDDIANFDVLLIDSIGILSSLYAYGDIAYIGGGFGVGIHNTLEAAVYGIPIIFGTKYQKFEEAVNMIKIKAAFSINNYLQLEKITDTLVNKNNYRTEAGQKAGDFVKSNIGAVDKIISKILN